MCITKKLPFVAAAFAVAGMSTGAMALEGKAADKRSDNQQQRIEQGEESGALNKREAKRLERAHNRTEKHIEKAKSDGTVTPQEAKKIRQEQLRQSKRIYRQKHDKQHSHTNGDSSEQ